jgi:signal transduction histidine kinase
MGILGMQERALLLVGRIRIEGGPQGGMLVRPEVPRASIA